jgi:hypothetical protein
VALGKRATQIDGYRAVEELPVSHAQGGYARPDPAIG